MAVRQAAAHDQRLGTARRHGVAAQHAAQRLDFSFWPIRQIGERAFLDLVAVAIAHPK